MNKKHKMIKLIFKIVGITLIVIGAGFNILGFTDFFTKVGTEDSPVFFWAIYMGIPLVAIGIVITISGFRKEITNYIKNETIETQKEIIKDITPEASNLVKETSKDEIICPKCGTKNDLSDNFCKKCGEPLSKTCPKCGAKLDIDSEYCDKCGEKLNDK